MVPAQIQAKIEHFLAHGDLLGLRRLVGRWQATELVTNLPTD